MVVLSLLTLGSYNLHGFTQGRSLLTDLFSELDVIRVQEHRLSLDNLSCLNNFNNYVGFSSSAMDAVLSKISRQK